MPIAMDVDDENKDDGTEEMEDAKPVSYRMS